jgi:hypothetical protein
MGSTSKTQESNDVFDEDLFGSDDEDGSDENNITSRRSRVNRSLDTSSSDDSDNETPIEQSGLSAHEEQRDGGEQNTPANLDEGLKVCHRKTTNHRYMYKEKPKVTRNYKSYLCLLRPC